MNDIKDILFSHQIIKLIYIDDELGKTSYLDNIKGKIRVLVETQNLPKEDYPFFQKIDIWENLFDKWWQDASFDDVVQLANIVHVLRTNSNIANKLIEVCPDPFQKELLAPEQFDDGYKKELIEELRESQKNAIVLIDYDLQNNSVNGDKLFESIADNKNIFCGIFSQKFEITGGNIKNIALTSAFMAAAENKKVSMKHIIKALSQEITKQGKIISRDDFAEYGYLL